MRTAGELTLTSDDPEVFLYEGADVPAEKVNKDAKLVSNSHYGGDGNAG